LCARPRCSSQPETELLFLRGLCVDRASRRQGLGTRLANEAVQAAAMASSTNAQLVYLFCEPQFLPMYIPAGFEERAPSEVPPAVAAHFGRVAGQQARKNNELRLMVVVQSSAASSSPATRQRLSIILLQHSKEVNRPTNTARPVLVNDERVAEHLDVVARWEWSGRADNQRIDEELRKLDSPVLLWSDGGGVAAARDDGDSHGSEEGEEAACKTFVILDGTWQEARRIFRYGPETLRGIPRLALKSEVPSSYVLRGDYGWRRRFSEAAESNNLCCTAEVGAMLLERAGDAEGGKVVREALEAFQREYAKTHPSVRLSALNTRIFHIK
jgi:DTW domain-containing protein YfiP